jgi:thioredoxin 1
MTHPIEATDNSFDNEVLQHNGYVLVDFWAPWCGPCRQLTPIIDELAINKHDKLKIVKINIDDNPEIATNLGIRSIPTLILFNNGKQLDTKLGALGLIELNKWLEQYKI